MKTAGRKNREFGKVRWSADRCLIGGFQGIMSPKEHLVSPRNTSKINDLAYLNGNWMVIQLSKGFPRGLGG